MLKAKYPTEASKLGVIAATYRAGTDSIFSTCPSTCSLLPKPKEGTSVVDTQYLQAELQAVPRDGAAWSYTHFKPDEVPKYDFPIQSTLNYSTDTLPDALNFAQQGYPTVYAAPTSDSAWPRIIQGIRFIRCPAEIFTRVTCQTCGNGQPLCARAKRNFVIVFTAHGTAKKKVGDKEPGGCYASQGRCLIQWRSTQKGTGPTTWNETNDPDRLIAWANSLPKGTLLRHRISGDIGLCTPSSSLKTVSFKLPLPMTT